MAVARLDSGAGEFAGVAVGGATRDGAAFVANAATVTAAFLSGNHASFTHLNNFWIGSLLTRLLERKGTTTHPTDDGNVNACILQSRVCGICGWIQRCIICSYFSPVRSDRPCRAFSCLWSQGKRGVGDFLLNATTTSGTAINCNRAVLGTLV